MSQTVTARALGIDLGGTSVKAVAVTAAGQTVARHTVSFDSDPTRWAEAVRAVIDGLEQKVGRGTLREGNVAVGVSAPGLAAPDGHSIAFMPGRLEGLQGLDWTRFLGAAQPVPVLNDAHAALLGESWLGAARGFANVILLTLGTGVGGAAMVDGRLLRGHLGRAGHLGHVSLDPDGPPDITRVPGSLEDAIGNCTVAARTGGRFQTTHELVAAYRAGDPEATRVWLRSVRVLACAIAGFINVLDPETVIIGGGIARAGAALFEPLERFLDEVEWRPGGARVQLRPAQLREWAGAYGAAGQALGPARPAAA